MGAVFGVVVGLPALRLRTFYFAMTTLGFATIVTQVALAWKDVTGGGVGTPGPVFPWPFEPGWGFYYFCFAAGRAGDLDDRQHRLEPLRPRPWSPSATPRWRPRPRASPSRAC